MSNWKGISAEEYAQKLQQPTPEGDLSRLNRMAKEALTQWNLATTPEKALAEWDKNAHFLGNYFHIDGEVAAEKFGEKLFLTQFFSAGFDGRRARTHVGSAWKLSTGKTFKLGGRKPSAKEVLEALI